MPFCLEGRTDEMPCGRLAALHKWWARTANADFQDSHADTRYKADNKQGRGQTFQVWIAFHQSENEKKHRGRKGEKSKVAILVDDVCHSVNPTAGQPAPFKVVGKANGFVVHPADRQGRQHGKDQP